MQRVGEPPHQDACQHTGAEQHDAGREEEVRPELLLEIGRCGALDRVHYGLDYFDASINRIGALLSRQEVQNTPMQHNNSWKAYTDKQLAYQFIDNDKQIMLININRSMNLHPQC